MTKRGTNAVSISRSKDFHELPVLMNSFILVDDVVVVVVGGVGVGVGVELFDR